ncbi:putative membrane protein [Albimonas donghaensis]|uniref:Protoporphyrinogen IX oxidase n=1 Tax=Albimonas donghaensis TaxID=356660 RepID=A0A1H2Z370_9RHOB|nr:protoporphyrinogen oxidase HemJ [Albimonas donghaensis]SDX11448.1 putative membrane protein [Albimonas donghaensis]
MDLLAWYPWFKAIHVMSVIAWMAALLYLPRLFVYHAERGAPGSELSETFKVMERKLLRGIMNPAMISSWTFGLLTLVSLGPGFLANSPWLHAKLLLVVLMTGYHMACARFRRDFAEDANRRSGRFYRMINEIPALLMVGIVILVIVQPF